jgi:hypothetical protein
MYRAYRAGRSEKDPAEFWYKGEIGFFDFYIIPLAKKLKDCGVFGVSSDEYLNYAIKNREEWSRKGEAVTAEMVAKARDKESARMEHQASMRGPIIAEMKAAVRSMRSPQAKTDMFKQPSFRHLRVDADETETMTPPMNRAKSFGRQPPGRRRALPAHSASIGSVEREAMKRFRRNSQSSSSSTYSAEGPPGLPPRLASAGTNQKPPLKTLSENGSPARPRQLKRGLDDSQTPPENKSPAFARQLRRGEDARQTPPENKSPAFARQLRRGPDASPAPPTLPPRQISTDATDPAFPRTLSAEADPSTPHPSKGQANDGSLSEEPRKSSPAGLPTLPQRQTSAGGDRPVDVKPLTEYSKTSALSHRSGGKDDNNDDSDDDSSASSVSSSSSGEELEPLMSSSSDAPLTLPARQFSNDGTRPSLKTLPEDPSERNSPTSAQTAVGAPFSRQGTGSSDSGMRKPQRRRSCEYEEDH